jgi:hypothetical protein
LREGIVLSIELMNSVKEDEKDGDVDVRVRIRPNETEKEFGVRSKSGKYTEPELPASVIISENGVVIEHYYRSNDHAPAHMHVTGDGSDSKIRIGANGKVLKGDPPLNSKQKKVISSNLAKIRRAGDRIKRWLVFHDYLINQ